MKLLRLKLRAGLSVTPSAQRRARRSQTSPRGRRRATDPWGENSARRTRTAKFRTNLLFVKIQRENVWSVRRWGAGSPSSCGTVARQAVESAHRAASLLPHLQLLIPHLGSDNPENALFQTQNLFNCFSSSSGARAH